MDGQLRGGLESRRGRRRVPGRRGGGLAGHLESRAYVCGDRFTAADVYVGAQVDWGLLFKSLPERPEFLAYAERLRERPAYKAAKAIDGGGAERKKCMASSMVARKGAQ